MATATLTPPPTRRTFRLTGLIKPFASLPISRHPHDNVSMQEVTYYLVAKDLSKAPSEDPEWARGLSHGRCIA